MIYDTHYVPVTSIMIPYCMIITTMGSDYKPIVLQHDRYLYCFILIKIMNFNITSIIRRRRT